MPLKNNVIITDGISSDPQALERSAGAGGRALIKVMDRAVSMQTSVIERYVNYLRSQKPEATPAQIQQLMDKHFRNLATGSGAGVGATAMVPGIGFLTGAVAISAESVVFLDAAAFYTVSSAYLRGVDITEPERRRALILVVLLGSKGNALTDIFAGDMKEGSVGLPSVSTISRFSVARLGEVNNRLMRIALRQVTKKMGASWLGKIMPFGIGAVIGSIANRKLAGKVINNAAESLGAPPAQFSAPAPAKNSIKAPKIAFLRRFRK
ncbi:hypothetical protein [Corynebacterium sp. A21]|uniref:hypothetical protein n=1 Tax=Corynebacterium sp. A21 TaxID=3457318 RepID=UPI003FD3AC84